jgi:hypothetical protein
MPLTIVKEGKCYSVKGPRGKVYATCTTKRNAEAQWRLLQGIEHGWKPTGKKAEDEREKMEGGKVEVVNEQPILMPDKEEDVSSSESEKECNKKEMKSKKTMTTGTGAGAAWKAYVKKHMAGKKFNGRGEVNEYMKKLAKEFKGSKGAGVEPLLLQKDLGKGEHIRVPGPLAKL